MMEGNDMNKQSLSGLKTLFLIHFIVGLVFGLVYLLIPGLFLAAVNWRVPDTWPYRVIGIAVLAFTASSWLCYRECEWDKVKIVIQAEIVWTGLVALLSLYSLLFSGLPAAGWLNVILMGGFAIAFAYFYFKGK
jgi:hypothetical protein